MAGELVKAPMPNDLAHTISKLTKAQLWAFERIAVGLDRGVHPKTAAALLQHGLIEEDEETLPSRPTPVTITRYFVALHLHMEWCSLFDDKGRLRLRKQPDA
jgi:hypothetical protein